MNDRKVVIHQGCLDQGIVRRGIDNLNLCSNPNCTSCGMYHTILAMAAKEFTDWINPSEGEASNMVLNDIPSIPELTLEEWMEDIWNTSTSNKNTKE